MAADRQQTWRQKTEDKTMPNQPPNLTALSVSEIRSLLPVALGSAEIRDQIAVELRANAVFSARTTNAVYLGILKKVIDEVAAGRMDQATARVTLLEALRALGYTPEEGFPDDPEGTVPEAVAGTLQDLSSRRRLDLIINTQRALMIGRSQQLRGMEPARLQQFPAFELVRMEDREVPRNWGGTQTGSPPIRQGQADLRSRWTIAGGNFWDGRMIALKGDPVWGELGSSENFDDALDTDHPPFAFNSGMGWAEVALGECRTLGITGPNGETLEEWLAMDHPVLTGTQPALPVPQISVKDVPPPVLKKLEKVAAVTPDGTAYPQSADSDDLRARIAARRAARAARRESRAADWVARVDEAEQQKGEIR
jgi:hypothetical protein